MYLPFYPYVYPSGGYSMPDKYKESILDRSAHGRYLMDRIEHWTTASQRELIFQFLIWPNGTIALDRVDDWWEDEHGFIPKHWEAA